MHYEGTTYRPLPEADSLLLQVTVGCAHNSCSFCDMYRDVNFRRIPIDQIEADLQEARELFPKAERIFLVNGDAFVLKAKFLKDRLFLPPRWKSWRKKKRLSMPLNWKTSPFTASIPQIPCVFPEDCLGINRR
jgi:radical SAM superfamily enzyme YgiQ (UPF0313 family)